MEVATQIKTELNFVIGKLLRGLRRELRLSQTAFGAKVGYDRSLIARIEVGRNVASIEDIYRFESFLKGERLIERFGDLTYLAGEIVETLERRGVTVVVGRLEPEEGVVLLHPSHIERTTETVLDRWLGETSG